MVKKATGTTRQQSCNLKGFIALTRTGTAHLQGFLCWFFFPCVLAKMIYIANICPVCTQGN